MTSAFEFTDLINFIFPEHLPVEEVSKIIEKKFGPRIQNLFQQYMTYMSSG